MHEAWEKTEITLSVVPRFFDHLVYLEVTERFFYCSKLQPEHGEPPLKDEEQMFARSTNKKIWNICVSKKYYETQHSLNKGDPRWVRSVPEDEAFTGLSEHFLKMYKKGDGGLVNYNDRPHITPLIELLEAGKFEFIGRDETSENSDVVTSMGEPLPRDIFLGYLDCNLYEAKYKLKSLLKHLEQRSDVRDAKIIDIPYYNADDSTGEECIEFYYIPETLEVQMESNYWVRNRKILEILGVKDFLRKSEEDV